MPRARPRGWRGYRRITSFSAERSYSVISACAGAMTAKPTEELQKADEKTSGCADHGEAPFRIDAARYNNSRFAQRQPCRRIPAAGAAAGRLGPPTRHGGLDVAGASAKYLVDTLAGEDAPCRLHRAPSSSMAMASSARARSAVMPGCPARCVLPVQVPNPARAPCRPAPAARSGSSARLRQSATVRD